MSTITPTFVNNHNNTSSAYQLDHLTTKTAETTSDAPATTGKEDIVSLSKAAQAYLASLGNTSSTSLSEKAGFTLSRQQEATLTAILEKYEDVEYNQENFEALQADLEHAGLSPQRLAIEEEIRTFSSTEIFLSALNGEDTLSNLTGFSFDAYEDKMNTYMKTIVAMWAGEDA